MEWGVCAQPSSWEWGSELVLQSKVWSLGGRILYTVPLKKQGESFLKKQKTNKQLSPQPGWWWSSASSSLCSSELLCWRAAAETRRKHFLSPAGWWHICLARGSRWLFRRAALDSCKRDTENLRRCWSLFFEGWRRREWDAVCLTLKRGGLLLCARFHTASLWLFIIWGILSPWIQWFCAAEKVSFWTCRSHIMLILRS